MRTSKILLILGVVLLSALGTGCGSRVPPPTEKDQARFQKACQPVILWLDAEQRRVGRYPEALPPALARTLKTVNPDGAYRPTPARDAFEIRIGDYSKYEWEYCYWSKTKVWYMDQ